MPTLYVVVPCYNEQEVLPETTKRLTEKLEQMMADGRCDGNSCILYVDDGSRDDTWRLIQSYHQQNPLVCGIKLAHNRGHQNALLAGLMVAKDRCDCAASMDADLQDDVNVLDGFMEKFAAGCQVVYGVRSKRETDSGFKRITAQGYYKLLRRMGVEAVYNHADCRLLSRRALEELSCYRETNLFLRGIVPHMGFEHDVVYFERAKRFAGETKYSLKKMLALAWDGITSFSVKPLKWITGLGVFLTLISFLALLLQGVFALTGQTVSGLLAAVTSVWLLGGLLLTAMGILGSYLGKMYQEVKDRPRFTVEQYLLTERE